MAPNYDDHDNTERPRSRYGEGGGWEDPPEQFEGDRGAEPPPKQPRTFGGGRKSKGRAPRTYGGHQVPTAGNNSPAVPRSQPRQPKPAKVRAGNGADRPFTVTLAFVLTLLAGVSSLVWGAYLFAAFKSIGQEGETAGWVDDQLLGTYHDEIRPWIMGEWERNDGGMSQQEAIESILTVFGGIALGWAGFLLIVYLIMSWLGPFTGPVGKVVATLWFLLSLFMIPFGFLSAIGGLFTFAAVALSLVAAVLIWLPSSLQHIRDKKARKQTGWPAAATL